MVDEIVAADRHWPAEPYQPVLSRVSSRLATHLCGQVDPDGAVRHRCASRVLESALALRLLARTGARQPAIRPLTSFLHAHRHSDDPLESILARAALGEGCNVADPVERMLGGFPHFTAPRKRLLLQMVLAILEPGRGTTGCRLEDFVVATPQRWLRVILLALKVIYAKRAGRPDWISDQDVDELVASQRGMAIWEQHILAHVLVLHALAEIGGAGDLIFRGIDRLLAQRNLDGGVPFTPMEEIWCTATAGLALHAAHVPAALTRRMCDYLAAQQQPDGGWTFAEGVTQADTDCTSACVELLHAVSVRRYRRHIDDGLRLLRSLQGMDGGFPTYVPGAPSEVSMTAVAANALITARPVRSVPAVARAVQFVVDRQAADGSFEPGWSRSLSHVAGRVLRLARRCPAAVPGELRPRLARMQQRCAGHLRRMQNPDGGWGHEAGSPSDEISTAHALAASSQLPDPHRSAEGVHYLAARQSSDGGFRSVPDSVGPRPFVFDQPVLADIYILSGLAQIASRLPAGSDLAYQGRTRE